jgi:YD repeat-containing protein
MKKIFLIAGVFTAFFATSCKKDKNDDTNAGNGNGNGGGSVTKLLKKFTHTEAGETTIYNLAYNGNKKLVSVIATDNDEKRLFTYDNGGNLTKVDETEDEFHNVYTYTYNAAGEPVSATFKSWKRHGGEPDELIEDDVLTYTVSGGLVTRIHLNMLLGEQETDFDFSYVNGNLTKVQSVNSPFAYTASFTYGTKKPVFPIVSKYVLDHAGFSLQFAAKNEITSIKFDFPGTDLDRTTTNQYTYDSNGYVLTSTDGTASIKFEYE